MTRRPPYFGDTPAMNEELQGIAYEEDQHEPGGKYAVGAVGYQPATERARGGFYVMVVTREGKVRFSDRPMDRRSARQMLQMAASMVGEQVYDKKARAFVHVLDEANVKPKRTGLSPRTRWEVLERDGRRCRYCGADAPGTILHVDHVRSRKDGGSDDLTNLVTSCRDCNLGKSSKSLPAVPEAAERMS